MSVKYSNLSPWFNTPVIRDYLDVLAIRSVPAESDDYLYSIEPQYTYRPDLLAYDLYGNKDLGWVFIQRTLDVLQDPIFDFVPGTKIYLPKNTSLKEVLGG